MSAKKRITYIAKDGFTSKDKQYNFDVLELANGLFTVDGHSSSFKSMDELMKYFTEGGAKNFKVIEKIES